MVPFPLALPGLGTVAILDLLFTWNELLWPLVLLSDQDAYPVSAAVITFRNQYRVDNGNLFAAYVSVSIDVMEEDTKRQRQEKPYVFADLKSGKGIEKIIKNLSMLGGL